MRWIIFAKDPHGIFRRVISASSEQFALEEFSRGTLKFGLYTNPLMVRIADHVVWDDIRVAPICTCSGNEKFEVGGYI